MATSLSISTKFDFMAHERRNHKSALERLKDEEAFNANIKKLSRYNVNHKGISLVQHQYNIRENELKSLERSKNKLQFMIRFLYRQSWSFKQWLEESKTYEQPHRQRTETTHQEKH